MNTHNQTKPSSLPLLGLPAFGDCARYLRDQAWEDLSTAEKRFVLECCSFGFNRQPEADRHDALLWLFSREWERAA